MSYPMNTLPLRDDDCNKPNTAPNSGPEVIDLEPTASGINDGLLPPNRPDGKPGSRQGRRPPSDIPGFSDSPGELEHVSVFHYKPSYMAIMMCISLVAANLSQLKYILESGGDGHFYYSSLIMISLSIIFQAAVFLGLIFLDIYKKEGEFLKVACLEGFTIGGTFLITVFNALIAAFVSKTVNINSGGTDNN